MLYEPDQPTVIEVIEKTSNVVGRVPKFRLLTEHGRSLRLDDDAGQKLLLAAKACDWKPSTFELFRDVIILARDTGMRNQRELYRIRVENLDWNNPSCRTARPLMVEG